MNDSDGGPSFAAVVYFLGCGFVAGYLYASTVRVREHRAARDRESVHQRLFELERALGLYDPLLDMTPAAPAPPAEPAPAKKAK